MKWLDGVRDKEPGEGSGLSHCHPRISAACDLPGRLALTLLPLGPGVPGIPCRARKAKQKGLCLAILNALLSWCPKSMNAHPGQPQDLNLTTSHPSAAQKTQGQGREVTSFPGDPDGPRGPANPSRPLFPRSPLKTKPFKEENTLMGKALLSPST